MIGRRYQKKIKLKTTEAYKSGRPKTTSWKNWNWTPQFHVCSENTSTTNCHWWLYKSQNLLKEIGRMLLWSPVTSQNRIKHVKTDSTTTKTHNHRYTSSHCVYHQPHCQHREPTSQSQTYIPNERHTIQHKHWNLQSSACLQDLKNSKNKQWAIHPLKGMSYGIYR